MGCLRLLLAISVVFAHAGGSGKWPIIASDRAVEVFFIISGFYMAMVLNEKYLPSPSASKAYRLFLGARALRLLPVYLVILVVTVVAQAFWLRAGSTTIGGSGFGMLPPALSYWKHFDLNPVSAVLLAVSNLLMLGQDGVMFVGINSEGALYFTRNFHLAPLAAWHFLFIPQAWSLGLEALFYLLAPFLVRRSALVITGVALLSFGLRLTIHHHGLYNDPWSYRFFPSELCFFLLGALAYRAYRLIRAKQAFRPWQGIVALALALCGVLFSRRTPLWHHPELPLIIFALCVPLVFALTRANKIDRWIGELSYPLYVVHVIMIQALNHAGHGRVITTITCSLIASICLMLAVDQPVERLRQAWIARQKGLASAKRETAAIAINSAP